MQLKTTKQWMGASLSDLPTPALLVDRERLQRNIASMAARAKALNVSLRPHIKTHKTLEIAGLQQEAGASGLTVSTPYEAEVYGAAGFSGLLLAFPVQMSRMAELQNLVELYDLELTLDSPVALEALKAVTWSKAPESGPVKVWMKVDCGYGRCGVDPTSEEAVDLAQAVSRSPRLTLAGILSHSGHAYSSDGANSSRDIAEQERALMSACAQRLRASGVIVPNVSVGSTPAISHVADLQGVSEIRPGNYAYFDGMQVDIGSCAVEDCALTVLSMVVSSRRGESICDSGALVLSKDIGAGQKSSLGEVFEDLAASRLSESLRLVGLSQEHGKLSQSLPVGKRIRILPNHSCLTAACFDEVFVVEKSSVVDVWRVLRGRS